VGTLSLIFGVMALVFGVALGLYSLIATIFFSPVFLFSVGIAVIVSAVGSALIIKYDSDRKKKKDEYEEDETSLEILKQRYAKGELSKEEFDKMKKDLV